MQPSGWCTTLVVDSFLIDDLCYNWPLQSHCPGCNAILYSCHRLFGLSQSLCRQIACALLCGLFIDKLSLQLMVSKTLNSYIIIVHCITYHTSHYNAAGALVYSAPRIWRLLELQLTLPSTTAAVPVLP